MGVTESMLDIYGDAVVHSSPQALGLFAKLRRKVGAGIKSRPSLELSRKRKEL